MSFFFILIAIMVLGALVSIAAVKLWPKGIPLSLEERKELAVGPKPLLQKRARLGFAVMLATAAATFAIVSHYGAATYYEDDTVRLTVVAIFIAGLILYTVIVPGSLLTLRARAKLDELDEKVITRAPSFQSAAMLVAYAAWSIYLTETFRGEGGIPGVYLYLIFGTLCLVSLLAHAGGVLVGYWMSKRHA